MIGIGIIGTGAIGGWHVEGVRESGLGEVRSVYNRSFDRSVAFAEEWGIEHAAHSIEEMLARPDIDAVIVGTPPDAHLTPTLAAIEAGKHVLCEKPLALNFDEAVLMVEAAERAGVHLACLSGRDRYTLNQSVAHAMIENGEVGDVYYVRQSYWRMRGRPGHHMYPGVQWWLDSTGGGGGVLIDNGVYMIDSVLWMLGNPEIVSVTAQTRQAIEEPPPAGMTQDVEDFAVILIQCEGGKSAVIEVAWVSNMFQENGIAMEIHGTKAGLRIGREPLTKVYSRLPEPDEIQIARAYDPERAVEERIITREQRDGNLQTATHARAATTAFVTALARGEVPQTPGREALQVTRVMDAAYRSAREGGSATLPEVPATV